MVVNKQGIVDAELQTFPWEHILVDNFIEENTFNELQKIAVILKVLNLHSKTLFTMSVNIMNVSLT